MTDQQKTKKQLIEELAELRQRLAASEASSADQRRQFELLQKNEAQWRSLVADMPVFVATVDRAGTIQYLNHPAPGYTPEDALGESVYEFLEPNYRETAKKCVERVFDTGQTAFYETVAAAANRTTAWYETYVGPVKVGEKVVAATLVSKDITRRKEAEQERDRTQTILKATIDCLPFDFFALGLDGRYILQNAVSKTHWGCAIRKRPEDICPDEEDLALWKDNNRRAFSGERIEEDVNLICNGERRFYSNILTPIRSAGTMYGILGMNIDITERKQAETKLMQERNRAQQYLDVAAVIMVVLDNEGTITLLNKKGNEILGYPQGTLLGKNWFRTCVPERLHNEVLVAFRQLMTGDLAPVEYFENPVITHSGEERIIAWQNSLLTDQNGQIVGTLSSGTDFTERKLAEEALQESEERFRQAMEATHDGLWDWNVKSGEVYYSPAYFRMLGYEPAEFANEVRSWIDLLHPDDRAAAIGKNQACIENRIPNFEVEFRIQTKNGEWKTILGRGKAVCRDANGHAIRMIGTHVDITERKRAEEDLLKAKDDLERRVEERTADLAIFQKFAGASGRGFGMMDLEGRITYANQTLCRFFGEEKPENVIGMHLSTYYPEEYKQQWENEIIPAVFRDGTWQGEQVVLSRRGTLTPTFPNAFLIRDENGKPFRLAVAIVDISGQKKVEAALRASEEKYRRLVEACPDAVVMSDAELRIVFASQRAVELYGAKDDAEMFGRNLIELIADEERPRAVANVSELLEGGVRRRSEYTCLHKDGSRFPCELSSSVVKSDSGQFVGIVGVVRDITERKQAEDALRREHRTLKHLLQSSDHERQTIAYEIHDGLAQYLAGAIMQFDVYKNLLEKKPNEATKVYEIAMSLLRQGHFAARRLIAGVRHPVLDESGVVEAIVHLINEQNREKGPQIDFTSRVRFSRLVPILENAIYRICQEGLSNACQHSESPRVLVGLRQRNDRIRIEIRDWGIGFDPKNVKEGSYGLIGIRERARLLGGKHRIQSTVGKGTRITVELPLMEREE